MRPLCLATFGIGARQQDAVVRVVRARGPDLLAVDDPVVALLLGAGAQARDVGTAGGFGEQLTPDLFARGQRRQVLALLLLAGERHHGRPAHAVADDEHAGELAERALFLLPDHALDRRRSAAAIFLRPVQAGPAGIGLLLLPGFCDLENVGVLERGTAERGFAKLFLVLLRRVGRYPRLGLGAERGFLRGVIEVHERRPSNSAVVPANAGTHNHRPTKFNPGSRIVIQSRFPGVWVPAFAGTTTVTLPHAAFFLRMRSIN